MQNFVSCLNRTNIESNKYAPMEIERPKMQFKKVNVAL